MKIRSISFDTSFLLKDSILIDDAIKKIEDDGIPCFITKTVVSELDQLKIWGRITDKDLNRAIKRYKRVHTTVIDFKNRLLSNGFGKMCTTSMEKYHGIKPEDIVNDCNILVSTLKNGVDLFLSEDFHFTSRITKEVINEISNAACSEFHMMCDTHLYSVDVKTFLEAYNNGDLNLEIVESRIKNITKKGKRFDNFQQFVLLINIF